MATESTIQWARIVHGAERSAGPYCPICGKTSAPNDAFGRVLAPCGHLLFLYCCESMEALFQTLDFGMRVEAYVKTMRASDPEFDPSMSNQDFKDMLPHLGYGESVLVLEITQQGFACGPTETTFIAGYDFEIEDEDEVG